MKMILELLIIVLTILSSVFGTRNSDSYVLPTPLGPEAPICSSYNRLCHLAYNLTELRTVNSVVQSEQEICHCPEGQECETSWEDRDNSIIKEFKMGGHDMTVKMSYCNLLQPSRVCRKNDEAIVMRGRGAFIFEIVEDFRCRCYRNLYEHRSWMDGAYTYIAYSCGKPKCSINSHPSPVCATMTYDGAPGQHQIDYSCRCLRNQECTATRDLVPTPTRRTVHRTCQQTSGFVGQDEDSLPLRHSWN